MYLIKPTDQLLYPYYASLDPIWTLQTDSLFILSIDAKQLFAGDGLFCRVVDYDVINNDEMGFFVVPPDVLYRGNGEREVFKLKPPAGTKGEVPGHLAIRCRRATQYDKDFLKEFKASQIEKARSSVTNTMLASHAAEGGKSNLKSIISKNVKYEKNGTKKVRRKWDVLIVYIDYPCWGAHSN